MPQQFPANAWLTPLDARLTQASSITEHRWPGRYLVQKFGRNADVDGAEDIWSGGGDHLGFPVSAELFTTVSDDAADASGGTGARTWRWWYMDDDLNAFDADGEWLYFDVTLVTVPLGYTGYLFQYGASMLGIASNTALIGIREVTPAGVEKVVRPFAIGTARHTSIHHEGGIPFVATTSIIMRALEVGNMNADISAYFDLMLVKDGT